MPDAFNEGLNVTPGAAAGGFSSSGSIANVTAGSTSPGVIQVALNTGMAGIFTGTAMFSAASHDADLIDAPLSSLDLSLTGQVNKLAQDAFIFGSGAGTFSHTGLSFTLNFGSGRGRRVPAPW